MTCVFAVEFFNKPFGDRLEDDFAVHDSYLELIAIFQPQGFAYRFGNDQLTFGR